MKSWLGDLESMRILIMYFWVGDNIFISYICSYYYCV